MSESIINLTNLPQTNSSRNPIYFKTRCGSWAQLPAEQTGFVLPTNPDGSHYGPWKTVDMGLFDIHGMDKYIESHSNKTWNTFHDGNRDCNPTEQHYAQRFVKTKYTAIENQTPNRNELALKLACDTGAVWSGDNNKAQQAACPLEVIPQMNSGTPTIVANGDVKRKVYPTTIKLKDVTDTCDELRNDATYASSVNVLFPLGMPNSIGSDYTTFSTKDSKKEICNNLVQKGCTGNNMNLQECRDFCDEEQGGINNWCKSELLKFCNSDVNIHSKVCSNNWELLKVELPNYNDLMKQTCFSLNIKKPECINYCNSNYLDCAPKMQELCNIYSADKLIDECQCFLKPDEYASILEKANPTTDPPIHDKANLQVNTQYNNFMKHEMPSCFYDQCKSAPIHPPNPICKNLNITVCIQDQKNDFSNITNSNVVVQPVMNCGMNENDVGSNCRDKTDCKSNVCDQLTHKCLSSPGPRPINPKAYSVETIIGFVLLFILFVVAGTFLIKFIVSYFRRP